ncbi:hypothetical protein MNBD_GAMMA26-1544 [hydrothermal vent metagenome]|uniref:DUF2066 domain-containing protein n=1 Tax=hydrothermal vent metagenome TaxID=652676 RepID=A0A3B1BKZ4_9ZZZZ
MLLSCASFALLFYVVAGGTAMAAKVSGLYGAEVMVEGQETGQRNKAIIEAFKRVLVKITGNRGIIDHPKLAKDIRKAPRYVQQYRYRLVQVEIPEKVAVPPVRMLLVSFDENAVNRLLRQRGFAVWGHMRPATLVWLSTEQDGWRTLVIPEADELIMSGLLTATGERGMPILFPLMDLEDQAALQVSDIWGGFADSIQRASNRYGPDAVITGRLVKVGPGLWRADWTLYLQGEELLWDSKGDSLAMAVEAGIHSGIDVLASRFAPIAGDDNIGGVHLRVAGIADLRSYARIKDYLMGQGIVEQAALAFVEPDAVTYALQVRGDQRALEQDISLSGVLISDAPEGIDSSIPPTGHTPPEVLTDSGEAVLRYRIKP